MAVETYRPAHQTQKRLDDPYRMYNCGAYSLAMALDRASLGGIRTKGETVRGRTDEPRPDPSSPGLSLKQLDAAALDWSVTMTNRTGSSWETFIADLNDGRGVILNGDRDQLGAPLCADPFKGLHSVFVNQRHSDGRFLVYDPLCAKAVWTPADMLKRYATKYGRAIGLSAGAIAYLATRRTPQVAT